MLLTGKQGPLPPGTINPFSRNVVEHDGNLVLGDVLLGVGTNSAMGRFPGDPDAMVAIKLTTAPVCLAPGYYQCGTVLGQVYAPSSVVISRAGNVGNGTMSNVWTGPSATDLLGIGWGLTYAEAQLWAGTPVGGAVTGPDPGFAINTGISRLPPAYVGVPIRFGQVGFTITAGSTPFAAGDGFAIETRGRFIPAVYQLCVKTATDGSQVPMAILADDTMIVGADAVEVPSAVARRTARAYVSGAFHASGLVFDPSWALADIVTALASINIVCR